MPLPFTINTGYNPKSPNVTEKYNPLVLDDAHYVGWSKTDPQYKTCMEFFETRVQLLTSFSGNLETFTYYSLIDETQLMTDESASTQPPIAVLSSNRSAGIKKCLKNTADLNLKWVNDPEAFSAGSSVWYDPRRVNGTRAVNNNATRNIYMFVNQNEYETYYDDLKDFTGIKLIGWSATDASGYDQTSSVGFGITRFMIFNFFKYLFKGNAANAAKTDHRVWMADDDVAFIRGFKGFGPVQDKLSNNSLFGLGFKGCTDKDEHIALYTALLESESGLDPELDKGFIQQVALWDLKIIGDYNFSPLFMLSKEDSTFVNYVKAFKTGTKSQIVKNYKVFKAVLENGSESIVKSFKLKIGSQFDEALSNNKDAQSDYLNLKEALAAGHASILNSSGEPLDTCACKAVEQIMEKIITAYTNDIPKVAFNISVSGTRSTSTQIIKTS